jgi:hypothetical protein
MTKTVSVVIPSVPLRVQSGCLANAIESVIAQDAKDVEFQIIVGLEKDDHYGMEVLGGGESHWKPGRRIQLKIVEGTCQATKVNAGVAEATGDYLAFLHDDDLWEREYLGFALGALKDNIRFVSASQLEVDEAGQVIGLGDFAVPSGWLMYRDVFDKVGPFDPKFKWHPDTEWLGRLERSVRARAHLLEKTAPHEMVMSGQNSNYNKMTNRPCLWQLLQYGRPKPQLIYTPHTLPLIVRRQHSDAIMQRIQCDAMSHAESGWETGQMVNMYGRIPW